MDILIKPKKNRYIIYAIIIAIFSTVGMNISLMNTNADKLLKKFEYSSVLHGITLWLYSEQVYQGRTM